MAERRKTLVLKRAYFDDSFEIDLESLLSSVFSSEKNPRNRIFQVDLLKNVVFATFEEAERGDGVFIRVFEYENGATGVINFKSTNNSADIEELLPPEDQSFLQGETVLLVSGNHVIASGMANKNRTLSTAICDLATKVRAVGEEFEMRIEDVPNSVSLRELRESGVAKIDLGVTDYLANFPSTPRDFGLMRVLFTRPEDPNKLRKRANTVGRMSLSRGRFLKDEIHKDEWLTEVGSEIVESDIEENYTIHLENGQQLTNRNLKVLKNVSVRRYANSVSFAHLKTHMETFLHEIRSRGLLK